MFVFFVKLNIILHTRQCSFKTFLKTTKNLVKKNTTKTSEQICFCSQSDLLIKGDLL